MDAQWDSYSSFRKLRHRGLYKRIGQGAYESEEGGVFSFFLPEYTPPGVVDTAGLVAPESQVLSGSKVSKLIDGILTTYKSGLTNCENGFGNRLDGGGCPTVEGDYSTAEGVLAYDPEASTADALIDELSLMLTAGRLGDTNRAIVKGAVEPYFNGDRPKAIRIAQQLITSSPEFHTTGLARKGDNMRELTGYTHPPKHDYKAIVHLFMVGGCDSFNMLVPLSGCSVVSVQIILRSYVCHKKNCYLNMILNLLYVAFFPFSRQRRRNPITIGSAEATRSIQVNSYRFLRTVPTKFVLNLECTSSFRL